MKTTIVKRFNIGNNQGPGRQPTTRLALVTLAGIVALLLAVQPQMASATTIVAEVCTVSTYTCPPAFTFDIGVRSNGVGTLLPNRVRLTALPL